MVATLLITVNILQMTVVEKLPHFSGNISSSIPVSTNTTTHAQCPN